MFKSLAVVVSKLHANIGTPRSAEVQALVDKQDWAQLQKLRVSARDYTDAESYWRDCLITDLLRKCDLPSGVDKEQAARDTFWLCERQNAATNARLTRYLPESLLLETPEDDRIFRFIGEMRKEINLVLGNLPDQLTPRFSGGATVSDTGKLTTIPDKMSSTPTHYGSTSDLLPFWEDTLWARGLRKERPRVQPVVVRGNEFFTVPKDATKHRGCCKEASINIGFQLDVGRLMKTRLLNRIGIDLKQGQSAHRELAKAGSKWGTLATIDMSNASDTVSRVLVKLCLRQDWHLLLDSLRATHTRIQGKWVRLEKFSSMGNGFTFELETLIFVCLARTIVTQEGGDAARVSCYGDDLIVPTEHANSVLRALEFFGFTPNTSKTFIEGPFRESCGGDFFSGIPVRGHFIEELPDEPQKWISLANGLRRVAKANGAHPSRWDVVRSAWLYCLDQLPSHIRRCRGPEALGDVVIHDEPEHWCYAEPPKGERRHNKLDSGPNASWALRWVYAYTPVAVVLPWHHWTPETQLASCVLGLPSKGVTPRDGVSGYRVARVPCGITSDWLPNNY